MSANNIDVTKVAAYAVIGGALNQVTVTKLAAFAIVDPTGTGPVAVRARRSVRVTRKTVADV